jgi:hypothetical protein
MKAAAQRRADFLTNFFLREPAMPNAKPIHYNLEFCFGSFDGDSADFESSTPFIAPRVGEFIDTQNSKSIMVPSQDPPPGQAYRVLAVLHSFHDFGSHISQYVRVCLGLDAFPY